MANEKIVSNQPGGPRDDQAGKRSDGAAAGTPKTAASTGKVTLQDFHFVKKTDKASAKL